MDDFVGKYIDDYAHDLVGETSDKQQADYWKHPLSDSYVRVAHFQDFTMQLGKESPNPTYALNKTNHVWQEIHKVAFHPMICHPAWTPAGRLLIGTFPLCQTQIRRKLLDISLMICRDFSSTITRIR